MNLKDHCAKSTPIDEDINAQHPKNFTYNRGPLLFLDSLAVSSEYSTFSGTRLKDSAPSNKVSACGARPVRRSRVLDGLDIMSEMSPSKAE